MEAMLESSPWLIRNVLLILKQWTLDANSMKEDVYNIPVWVKFHDVLITAFTKDGLSAIATKLARTIEIERKMLDGKLVLVDEHGKLLEMEVTSEASASKPSTSMGDQLVELNKDEVELHDDETFRYMPSISGGGFYEDDINFYDGYEAQVYDLPKQMQTFVINLISAFIDVLGSNFPSLYFIHKIGMSFL
nr:zinc knuckle CX2CX4HX4C [Tanacetum cinerariifolium]